MRDSIIAIGLTLAAVAASPAGAVTYDAFTSFNGVNGNGNFNYGYTDGATLTPFDFSGSGGACVLDSTICLSSVANGNIPQASIGGSGPTVSVPTNAILVHPGNSASLSDYAGFVATNAGSYSYTISLESVGKDTTNGIGYTPFTETGGVVTLGTRGVLPTYQSSATLTGTQPLSLGEVFGVVVDDNGIYYGDSTALNFTVSSVPEPATWGLMLLGAGLAGVALRRRRQAAIVA